MIKRDPSRFLQIGFLALLFLSILQVAWWISDNVQYTRDIQNELASLTTAGAPVDATLAQLEAASEGRANRYLWEGAFFLLVLVAGMAVLTRTLRHDTELRRRQQNFLAAVSHEFKSPLASMQLAAETLVLRSGDPDSRRLGQRILEDCERLLRMVENLLDTTRLEEGRHKLRTEIVALAPAVTGTIGSFSERAARHDIEIRADVPEALTVSIDRTALDTILRNLIDNALKACIAGDGHRIDVLAVQTDGRIDMTVRDDGLGFPPEDSRLMFEKFHRLGDEQTRKTPGTGLGLYIVKRLVELSGATIEASSAGPGTGATIRLSWPVSTPR
jgi:signal transduction histidine kinase